MRYEYEKITRSALEKLRELDAYFDRQLEALSAAAGDSGASGPGWKDAVKRWIVRCSLVMLGLLLPFLVLIRGSMFAYSTFNLNGWLALASGIAATILLLVIYGAWISFKVSGRAAVNKYVVRGITGLVLAYCCYGLLYLSSMNVKSEEVRSYYRSLHPILRVTLATTTLVDPQLIITDMRRRPDDYEGMGLPPLERSLHYEQSTGYVHAVDLRTSGRADWKNWSIRLGFNLLGYRTIRHVGTADHLHVALPLND